MQINRRCKDTSPKSYTLNDPTPARPVGRSKPQTDSNRNPKYQRLNSNPKPEPHSPKYLALNNEMPNTFPSTLFVHDPTDPKPK